MKRRTAPFTKKWSRLVHGCYGAPANETLALFRPGLPGGRTIAGALPASSSSSTCSVLAESTSCTTTAAAGALAPLDVVSDLRMRAAHPRLLPPGAPPAKAGLFPPRLSSLRVVSPRPPSGEPPRLVLAPTKGAVKKERELLLDPRRSLERSALVDVAVSREGTSVQAASIQHGICE